MLLELGTLTDEVDKKRRADTMYATDVMTRTSYFLLDSRVTDWL